MRKILPFTFLLFLTFNSFSLEAGEGSFDMGAGALSCKTYSKRSLDKKNEYIVWVQGFFSAFNALDAETKNILGTKNYQWVRQWFDDYCRQHPDQYFGEAVRVLIEDLYPTRIPAEKVEGLGIKNPEKLSSQEAKAILEKIKLE